MLGEAVPILGLRTSARILEQVTPALPKSLRPALEEVTEFASEARDNLDVAKPLIDRLAQPIEVDKVVVGGASPPLEIFAIAVAATLTLAFVVVLLVAGSLALEREENAFPRLTRGLVSGGGLLAEKVLLGVAVGLAVTLLMLRGWRSSSRSSGAASASGWWRSSLGGAALGAAGAALGAAAREVRAVSLLAFMVTLPIAFLSLVPSGAVSPTVFDVIRYLTALFPFKPALEAITAALDEAGSGHRRSARCTWRSSPSPTPPSPASPCAVSRGLGSDSPAPTALDLDERRVPRARCRRGPNPSSFWLAL